MEKAIFFEIPEIDVNRVHKEIAVEFLGLVGVGKPKDGLNFFAPDCRTRNPYTTGGMDALTDAMIAVQKQAAQGIIIGSSAEFKLIIRQVLVDGDLIAVRTQVSSSKPSEGGLDEFSFPF